MLKYNMFEAKTNLSKIAKILEDGLEEQVIIAKNGKPLLRITLINTVDTSKRIGLAKGLFTVPDDFDEIDISEDFEGEIFP